MACVGPGTKILVDQHKHVRVYYIITRAIGRRVQISRPHGGTRCYKPSELAECHYSYDKYTLASLQDRWLLAHIERRRGLVWKKGEGSLQNAQLPPPGLNYVEAQLLYFNLYVPERHFLT
jgi:hypothetical protein